MAKLKAKTQGSVTPKVATGSLTYVSGKARSDHNVSRAKAVNGMSVENALAHYKTMGYSKTDLNYDLNKIKSLVLK
tara:strand:+ start:151 stop:378 length:228 start_codon:yes stop_codon:yes gene_type:complete